LYGVVNYYLESTGVATPPTSTQVNLGLFKNGAVVASNNQSFAWAPTGAGQTATSGDIYLGVGNVFLTVGDELELKIFSQYFNNIAPHNIKVTNVVFENSVVNSGLVSGNDLDYNLAIPQNIKQKDLLSSVIKAFNLYIDVDNDNDKLLLIETRDDFYEDGTVKDWSKKLYLSQNIEYTPLGDLDFRKFKYSYKKDTDNYNKKYEDNWKEV